ncbi:MAG: glycosyltransferase, partial [Gammaproteobacteria bacterium]
RTHEKGALDPGIHIQLANTMGELSTLYAAADIAVVGGSLIPIRGIGGHNILEPCAVGVPVVFGINMGNFVEITSLTLAEKAGFQVENEIQLLRTLEQLLKDASLRASVGENGRSLIQR